MCDSRKLNCFPFRLRYGKYIKENNYTDNCPIVIKNVEIFDDDLLYSKNYFPTSCASSSYHYYAYGEKYSPESICVLTKASASGTGNSGKPYTPVCVKAIYTRKYLCVKAKYTRKYLCVKAICTRKYLYLVLDENNNVDCPRSGVLIKPKDTKDPFYVLIII